MLFTKILLFEVIHYFEGDWGVNIRANVLQHFLSAYDVVFIPIFLSLCIHLIAVLEEMENSVLGYWPKFIFYSLLAFHTRII